MNVWIFGIIHGIQQRIFYLKMQGSKNVFHAFVSSNELKLSILHYCFIATISTNLAASQPFTVFGKYMLILAWNYQTVGINKQTLSKFSGKSSIGLLISFILLMPWEFFQTLITSLEFP